MPEAGAPALAVLVVGDDRARFEAPRRAPAGVEPAPAYVRIMTKICPRDTALHHAEIMNSDCNLILSLTIAVTCPRPHRMAGTSDATRILPRDAPVLVQQPAPDYVTIEIAEKTMNTESMRDSALLIVEQIADPGGGTKRGVMSIDSSDIEGRGECMASILCWKEGHEGMARAVLGRDDAVNSKIEATPHISITVHETGAHYELMMRPEGGGDPVGITLMIYECTDDAAAEFKPVSEEANSKAKVAVAPPPKSLSSKIGKPNFVRKVISRTLGTLSSDEAQRDRQLSVQANSIMLALTVPTLEPLCSVSAAVPDRRPRSHGVFSTQ